MDGLGFWWAPFEDVYEEADFDYCLERLVRYEEEFKTGYHIAKKYKPDPELCAWVTIVSFIVFLFCLLLIGYVVSMVCACLYLENEL